MSKDAQVQATEGQSAADAPDEHVHTKAQARQSKQAEDVKTVTVRFEGGAEPATQLLEHAGFRLPKGQEVDVPVEVYEQLTTGDNDRLYRVVKV